MSKLDMLNMEITRREEASAALNLAMPDLLAAVEQFNKLDEMYRSDEKTSREKLEGIYKENRHFTGKQPLVYTSANTEVYPFFQGPLDADGNPYFPITKVQDKSFDGLSPYPAPPTKTGAWQRDANYSPIESVARVSAGAALQAFPDNSGEPLDLVDPGTGVCSNPIYLTQATCELNGETWTPDPPVPPVWVPADTATAKLRVPLQAWRADVVLIQSDVYNSPSEVAYWQTIIDNMDIVLAAVAVDPVYPNQTQPFTGPTEVARQFLITEATTGVPTHVSTRSSFLTTEATSEEEAFFGIIKLRLHQANGSFAKLRAAKSQIVTNKSLIEDNAQAISSLNLLKVKAS